MRIVAADRDLAFLEILQSYLWNQGHETEIAVDGLECTLTLREFIPRVVVLGADLQWGGADGVLEEMAQHPLLHRVPVILIGDTPEAGNFGDGRQIAKCLAKPFRLKDLRNEIELAGRIVLPAIREWSEEPSCIVPCQVCGRPLRSSSMLQGTPVQCRHCGGLFVAPFATVARS